MGKNCIMEVAKASPERLVQVYTSQKNNSDPLLVLLKEKGVISRFVPKRNLSDMVESDSHQGFVAEIKEKNNPTVKEFLANSSSDDPSLVLMLDSIYDPQNLGAIIRAAECFGVDLVVFSRNRGTDITAVVTKASVGASELIPIAKVSNLNETVKAFQKEGFWAVTAEGGPTSQSLYEFEFPQKTLLIMGSEGKGVQPILSKTSDFHVEIPMKGQIDSLNVSQATSVLLSSYYSSKRCSPNF